jgi:hypothetical protein
MKKSVIVLVALFAVSVFSIEAGIKFGLKAGVNLANASFSTDALKPDNYTGFQVGAITEFTLPVVGWGFDAALLYSQQGLKFDKDDQEGKMSTLDIPVNLKFKLGMEKVLGAYLATGPCASFSLSDGLSGLKEEYDTKSFGFGWNFGAGIMALDHLQIGVNYKLGLTEDYKYLKDVTGKDIKGKPRSWSITAAYFF